MIERVIAHFTTWRIMHTDYRRPLNTFATTISTVVGLYFYLLARIALRGSGRICCSRQPFRLIGAHRLQHSSCESLGK